MHAGHYLDAGKYLIRLANVYPWISTTPRMHTKNLHDRQAVVRPRQLDYNRALFGGFFPTEPEPLSLFPIAKNAQSPPFETLALRPARHYVDISLCAIHPGGANQKPPTIASCDRQ